MLGHLDRHFGQVEDLAALHPGDRPSRQPGPAPAAAARLMADLPVRPGHLRQRRSLMPVLAAGLAPALLRSDRSLGRLAQSLARRRPGGVPRVLLQPRLKLSDPLPGLLQLRPRLRQRGHRLGQSRRSDATSAASTSYGGGSSSPGTPGHYAPPPSPHALPAIPARLATAMPQPPNPLPPVTAVRSQATGPPRESWRL